MISVEKSLTIHKKAIERYGGAFGLRDEEALRSALARPFQTFGGEELYNSPFKKAAAIGESVIINHPFVDGNKRTGYILMESVLRYEGFKIISADDDLYAFVISIATGENKFEQIEKWLKENTASVNS